MSRIHVLMTAALLAGGMSGEAQDAGPGRAAESERPPDRPLRRWSAAVSIAGRVSEGPTTDVEDAMRAGRFDQPRPRRTEGYDTHPYTTGGDDLWPMLTIGYRLRPRFMVRLQGAPDREFNRVEGYHGPDYQPRPGSPPDRVSVIVRPSIQTFGALASYERFGFRLGAGPSLNRTSLEFDTGSRRRERQTRLGLVVEGAAETSRRSSVSFELWAQYHFVPSQAYGPLPLPIAEQTVATLPTGKASFSHLTMGAGIAVHVGRMR